MMAATNRVETDQVAREMEAGDLLIALFSNGIALDRTGTNGIERFQLITRFKQRLAFLDRLFTLDNIIKLIKLMLVKCERDAKLADTAILAMDSTTARLNAPYNSSRN